MEYYNRLYNSQGGELFQLRKAFDAASIFNPRVLKSISLFRAKILCDDLKKFGFKQFTNGFIEKLKREIIRLKVLADQ